MTEKHGSVTQGGIVKKRGVIQCSWEIRREQMVKGGGGDTEGKVLTRL